jgi:putative membrane protein
LISATAALLFGFAGLAQAADKVSANDFAEEASAKGIAEIETSKLALEKGSHAEVKKFAQTMIDDHTRANDELKALAKQKNLEVSNDAELMSKAKAMILQVRDGENFDKAYANNQVVAHEQAIELYQKAAASDDAEVSAWAKKTLPKLEHHLQMAKELQSKTRQ